MGNDHHGAVARIEHVFQPANGIDIQVVGRFVEQQDIRIREQRLCQQHTQLPARRDIAHRAIMLLYRNADADQQFAGARLGGVAVHFREGNFQFGHFHAVFVAHFRQVVDAVAFGFHLPQFLVAHDHGVEHGKFLEGELVLAQLADARVRFQRHDAGGGLEITAEDFHEGGLATAIGADQAVTGTGRELDGDIFEQRARAELHGDIGGTEHNGFRANEAGPAS